MRMIKILGLIFTLFIVVFFLTTALTDWVCKLTGYYNEENQEVYYLD